MCIYIYISQLAGTVEYPGYDIKLYLIMRLKFRRFFRGWGMWNTSSLPFFSSPPRSRIAVPVRFLSMGQIECFNYLLYLKPFNFLQTND